VKDYVPALMKYIEKYDAHLNFFHNLTASTARDKRRLPVHTPMPMATRTVETTFDMIHVVPPQTAPDFVRVSPAGRCRGLGRCRSGTLRHKTFDNIWALGDVMNAPNAKTAAAARKQAPVVAETT
jgi:sulfide:quinone oxidoreductase